eukprot:TRINITY_DN2284_c0_g1_i10.p1 TRINITY_DN2284_c0_g1~~TRINITY_DN2284_c0_g1_i10.p1  ORF type:complete len:184 (+),score=24.65 TRINITY_DN2284_c0_g1_i10:1280-1831(+)
MASSCISKLSRKFCQVAGFSRRPISSSCILSNSQISDNEFHANISDNVEEMENNIEEAERGNQQPYSREKKPDFSPWQSGIYKAIILGEVGQRPIQKRLRGGTVMTMFSVGTGGMRNNRRPLENESPREYADRSMVQWHRVAIYGGPLAEIAMKNLKPGDHVYLEGNLETKVFVDTINGAVRR